jgi:hypothetical protein
MPGPWHPKFQLRSGVSGGDGRLGRAGARRGFFIDEVAARVSFTVETTAHPSFSLGGATARPHANGT